MVEISFFFLHEVFGKHVKYSYNPCLSCGLSSNLEMLTDANLALFMWKRETI